MPLPLDGSRRAFLKTSVALAAATPLLDESLLAQSGKVAGSLNAYVGTYSSPLRDALPTQVDLPPGNGRGIHIFQVNRATGEMTPTGIHEMGTSPSCLALNTSGTRLYSANETDRFGEDKQGTVSAFAIDRTDGKLELLGTVRSGGAGPIFVSIHPSASSSIVAISEATTSPSSAWIARPAVSASPATTRPSAILRRSCSSILQRQVEISGLTWKGPAS